MPRQPNVLHKEPHTKEKDRDRRPSFGRKPSFSASSPSKEGKRRTSSSSSPSKGGNGFASGRLPAAIQVVPDNSVPPLPDFDFGLLPPAKISRDTEAVHTPTSADSFSKMLSRTAPTPVNGYSVAIAGTLAPAAVMGQQTEQSMIHAHIIETANKRISTMDYLRKAHEGRVYWFNTLLFDKPDLARMPYFDSRKLARRATNYLLLGLSLPAVTDLNSNNARDFLASLNDLLAEFENFQLNHPENGASSSSLSRARIPQMFRRATGPSSKGRRSSNAHSTSMSTSFPLPGSSSGGSNVGGGISSAAAAGGGGGGSEIGYPLEQSESSNLAGMSTVSLTLGSSAGAGPVIPAAPDPPASVMHFSAAETDLLPGEEYSHLLTPSLPFDPDFFETFATLCDVLIDTYTRLLSLVPTPRECSSAVGELFSKVDSRVRKIIIQGVVKEFEDSSRQGVKSEVANVGKVVLGGLM